MVFLFTILNVGIVLCSSFWSHAYPTTTDERTRPFSLPKFLHRNSSHLSNHSILRLNTSLPSLSQAMGFPQNHSFFQANHPLVGTTIPCTSDEKICLRHNMVYVPAQEACRPVGNSGGCTVVIERSITRRLFGVCRFENISFINFDDMKQVNGSSNDEQDGVIDEDRKSTSNQAVIHPNVNNGQTCSGYIMANDNKCYSREEIRDICGCDANPAAHELGGYVCDCNEPSPINVEQPKLNGLCRIPDFRNPDQSLEWSSSNFTSLSLNCSKEQMDCFTQNEIWMFETGNCSSPLERGPCPEDHVVALNESAAEDGFAEGTCVHDRGGCPVGYKRLRYDQKCYSDRELVIRKIFVNLHPFGLYDKGIHWIPNIVGEGHCGILSRPSVPAQGAAAENAAGPGWGVENDRGGIVGSSVNSKATNPSSL